MNLTAGSNDVAAPSDAPGKKSATKHEELTEVLRELAGRLQPGEKFPTQGDLMRQYHVSDTTVLRSLDELRRDGWIVRKQGSGTFVAPRPPAEVTKEKNARRTGLVAVMTRPSISPLFYDMIQGVEAALFNSGLAPVLIVDASREARIARARTCFEHGDVIGAIHVGSDHLSDLGAMPTVLMGETENGDHGQVSLDNTQAGRMVAEYLWDLNHREAVVVSIGHEKPHASEGVDALRVRHFRATWQKRGGHLPDARIVTHPFLLRLDDQKRAVEIMRGYLEPIFAEPNSPTALFALHDEMAAVAIRALAQMGLTVPGDVSVIGFNDSGTLAAYFQPALTTVRTPSTALGTLAVHLLQEMRRVGSAPRSLRLPPEIVVRESAAPLLSPSRLVSLSSSKAPVTAPGPTLSVF